MAAKGRQHGPLGPQRQASSVAVHLHLCPLKNRMLRSESEDPLEQWASRALRAGGSPRWIETVVRTTFEVTCLRGDGLLLYGVPV